MTRRFNSVTIWVAAREARDRARAASKQLHDHVPTDPIVSILLAAATVEGFINELGTVGDAFAPIKHIKPELRVSESFIECGRELMRLEHEQSNVETKLLTAATTFGGGAVINRGRQPLQDLHLLVTLRNYIMHIRSRDGYIVDIDAGTVEVEAAAPVVALQRRGIARASGKGEDPDWFGNLQTFEVADWACTCAYETIVAILKLIPDEPFYDRRALQGFFDTFFQQHTELAAEK
jgi:hypothetical protein